MAIYNYETIKKEYDYFREPVAVIRVNDKKISDSKKNLIVGDILVDVTCGYEASIASFCIYNCYDSVKNQFMIDDVKKYISLGKSVTISLGYGSVVQLCFVGFISKVNYIYEKNSVPYIQVTCMDAKGIMMSNCGCRQLVSNTYSDAVHEILQKTVYMKLQSKEIIKDMQITQTPDRKEIGLQTESDRTIELVNESDYEFIVRAAKRFNYEFYLDCGSFIFRKAKSNQTPIIELKHNYGIYSMDVQYDCTGVAGTVIVRGTDIDKGKVIEEKKKNNNKFSIGNDAKQLVKNNQKTYIDAGIHAQEDADHYAEFLMEDLSYRYGNMECTCVGLPEIKPGFFITIVGFGEGVSNNFYVVNVIHTLNQEDGFHTRIIGKANTLK